MDSRGKEIYKGFMIKSITLISSLLFIFSAAAVSKTPVKLNIKLAHGNEAERKGKELIEEFLVKYDIERDIFTKDISIEAMVIPHSHPVLTLNTRTIDEPNMYLDTFIHEQIHWFFAAKEKETQKFIILMKSQFPDAPAEKQDGAKDSESTYLHLGVCYFEFKAIERILGRNEAKRIFKESDVYTWVRKQVLEKSPFIAKALKDSDLKLQP
jgi:hypothetical protein